MPSFLKCDASRCLPCLTPALSLLPPAGVSEGGTDGRSRIGGFHHSQYIRHSLFFYPTRVRPHSPRPPPPNLCSCFTRLKLSPLRTLCQFIALLFFALSLPPPNAAPLGLPSFPLPHLQGKKNTNPCAELTFVSFSFLFLVKYYRLFCWKKK